MNKVLCCYQFHEKNRQMHRPCGECNFFGGLLKSGNYDGENSKAIKFYPTSAGFVKTQMVCFPSLCPGVPLIQQLF